MINKLAYKRVQKKWAGFSLIEKVFLGYWLILSGLVLFLPIIQVPNWTSYQTFKLINPYFYSLDLLILGILIFGILRNLSSKFRNFFYSLIGFRENEALVSFWLLFLLGTTLLAIASTVSLAHNEISSEIIILSSYFNLISFVILGWLILSFIMALNFSASKRKNHSPTVHFEKDASSEENNSPASLFEESINP